MKKYRRHKSNKAAFLVTVLLTALITWCIVDVFSLELPFLQEIDSLKLLSITIVTNNKIEEDKSIETEVRKEIATLVEESEQEKSDLEMLFETEEKLYDTPEATKYKTIFSKYRIKNGLPPLVFADRLNELAQTRVNEIKKDFSHYGIAKYGNFGENIVNGVYSEAEALETWDNSPGHKANMLSLTYTVTGYARSGGYAVQIFY